MDSEKFSKEIQSLLEEFAHDDANEEEIVKDIKAAAQQRLLRIKMYKRDSKSKK